MDQQQATRIIRDAAAHMWHGGDISVSTNASAATAIMHDPAMQQVIAALPGPKGRFYRKLTVEQIVNKTWCDLVAHCTCTQCLARRKLTQQKQEVVQ
jgi:hypothetical protein